MKTLTIFALGIVTGVICTVIGLITGNLINKYA